MSDPKQLHDQLILCQRDPARRVNFGYVDGHGKQPAVLALHPKTGARKLFEALQAETGVKAGAYGTAWVEDKVLTLQLEKPFAGLAKKARPPLHACGFRVTKVVIWNADGSVSEQEQEQEPVQEQKQEQKREPGPGDQQGVHKQLFDLLEKLKTAPLDPEGDKKRGAWLNAAAAELSRGNHDAAKLVILTLAKHRLPSKPLPAVPERATGTQPNQGAVNGDLDSEFALDDTGPAPVLDTPASRNAALSPSSAVAAAQQHLAEEDAAFERHRTLRKAAKIKASESQQTEAKKEEEEKAARKKLESQQKHGLRDTLRDAIPFGKKKDKDAKDPDNRVDQALDNKKADDKIKKYDQPFPAAGAAGTLDAALAKGVGAALDAGNHGDDIASAAGLLTASTAAAASSVLDVVRALSLYNKTDGTARAQHLQEAANAAGNGVGNLLNMGKASAMVAKHANAAEAASVVPILGIVAAVPELILELNQLRSAIARLFKQAKIHAQLEKAIQGGDTSQATLYTLVSGFIERDGEALGKGIAKVALDMTKIAGHGVTLGGITGPIGMAMVGIGSAGKLLMSAADNVQEFVAAHEANDRRKKLQPTLHALRDLKALVKSKPSDPETMGVIVALEALAQAEKGTPAHAAALDKLATTAEAFKNANRNSKEAVEFAAKLVEQAGQEKASWASGAGADAADPLAQKKGGALGPLEAQHRNARKLMGKDPQLAAQTLLDQALREGGPGGPAFAVLKSFGIEEAQVYGGPKDGDDRIAVNREIRQKILFELGADDETAKTLTQAMGEAKDSVKGYFSIPSKNAEMKDYMKAKNLLQHGGDAKRGRGWQLKMDLLTDDIEEKKETLLSHVEHLVAQQDIDAALAAQVRQLLAPRKDKATA